MKNNKSNKNNKNRRSLKGKWGKVGAPPKATRFPRGAFTMESLLFLFDLLFFICFVFVVVRCCYSLIVK